MNRNWKASSLIFLGAAFAGCTAAAKAPYSSCCAGGHENAAVVGHKTEPLAAPEPFARIALALRGCSSCSHCRSTIRQTTKAAATNGNVQMQNDSLEIVFADPTPLRLDEIVSRLANSGLHDLAVLDVLLDVDGCVKNASGGSLFLELRQTKQQLPLRISEFQKTPPLETPLRIRAIVQNWDGKSGPLSLELKYVIETPTPDEAEEKV